MMHAVADVSVAMVLTVLAGVLCFFAAISAARFILNLRWYRVPGMGAPGDARVLC
jgi:hypothetical protein